METTAKSKPIWLTILRWGARVIAILLIILYLIIQISTIIKGHNERVSPLTARDYMHYSLVAMFIIGLIIGFWREGSGGVISLVFIVAYLVIIQAEYPTNLMFLYIMAVPSVLYLLSWYFHRRFERQQ